MLFALHYSMALNFTAKGARWSRTWPSSHVLPRCFNCFVDKCYNILDRHVHPGMVMDVGEWAWLWAEQG